MKATPLEREVVMLLVIVLIGVRVVLLGATVGVRVFGRSWLLIRGGGVLLFKTGSG